MKDMILVSKDFQYSVNIGYDLNDKGKIENFIATSATIQFIEKIMLSVSETSTNRARILIGAYGKGKSHLVLVTLALLSQKDKERFSTLMIAIKKNNIDLYKYINNYLDSEKRLLPVIINGSNSSLSQSFMLALQRTLTENNMLEIMPETNFKSAINTIYKWEKEYPDVFMKLKEMISKPIREFINGLKNFSNSEYNEFLTIYPLLTAGSSFNPFSDINVVELYEKATIAIRKRGYNGIFVVYDEFSKYLEANITTASIDDIKMLQDFAEKCTRSGTHQLHLMLISHKEIANYIDKLPKQKVDGWRGVSERFEHNILQNGYEQTYDLISHVLNKDSQLWNAFLNKNSVKFQEVEEIYRNAKMFEDVEDIRELIRATYPLHPASTYILPRMSEKVAQNERTLFTFLAAEGTETLKKYINPSEERFLLVTPDVVYDYFAPQLRKEAYTTELHALYKLTNSIIQKLEDSHLETKIVKTISLIYALEQFEVLSPTLEEILKIYSCEYQIEKIEKAINSLIQHHYVVYLKRSNSYLKLKESTGVDVYKEIHDCLEINKNRTTADEILNKFNYNSYLYPIGYNDEYEITRFFKFEFIPYRLLKEITDWNERLKKSGADGIVFGVLIDEQEDIREVKEQIILLSRDMNRVVFVLPKQYYDITDTLYEFEAVNLLKEDAENDAALFDEYEMIVDDLQEIINQFIQEYIYPNADKTQYIYYGESKKITRKAQLTKLLSAICKTIFKKTPIINNEVINKNDISSIALNSRTKIIQALLRTELEPNLGLAGNGQEISIMRSVLILPGILVEDKGVTKINMNPEDENIRTILDEIKAFFEHAKSSLDVNFSELYLRLMEADYGYGLKRGVIPLYLATVLHEYKQYIVVKNRQGDVKLNASLINMIDEKPHEFTVVVENWSEEKELFVKRMEQLFSEYVIPNEKLDNNYSYIVSAIKRWYLSLPKYTKEIETIFVEGKFEKVEKSKLKFLKLLKQSEIGEQELLFEKIPRCFGYSEFTISVCDNIEATKLFFDSIINNLESELIKVVERMFKKSNQRESLYSIVQNWLEELNPYVSTHLFADGAEKCYSIFAGITHDEHLFIGRLAKGLTGLRIEDWNSDIIGKFSKNLENSKNSLESYTFDKENHLEAEEKASATEYQVTFLNNDGSILVKHFEKTEIGNRAKLLKNDIESSIDEMGYSISEQEKRQVIMDVLRQLCE